MVKLNEFTFALMNEKYYTPRIEDIRVGYEYESLQKQQDGTEKWIPNKIIRKYDLEADWEGWLYYNIIRVPYLTREQVESEGWKYNGNTFEKNRCRLDFVASEEHCELSIDDMHDSYLFQGTINSVNEFRTLIKWLGI